MAKYRDDLPQLHGDLFLTDGGLETTLVFLKGIELPHFASFPLLDTDAGRAALRTYFDGYVDLAAEFQTGLVLETPTWRANPDWGEKLGYTPAQLREVNVRAAYFVEEVRLARETPETPIVIGGCLGPRGDGYVPERAMTAAEAAAYHRPQIEAFGDSPTDLVSAMTMNYVEEVIGVVLAAREAGMPVVISITVETDGRLPTGQPLGEAIEQTDEATDGWPAYYMLNCAHPSHFAAVLEGAGPWTNRLRGLRANASRMSHAELDDAPDLDTGDPIALGDDYAALKRGPLKALNVVGGCCGTDERHVHAMGKSCLPLFRPAAASV